MDASTYHNIGMIGLFAAVAFALGGIISGFFLRGMIEELKADISLMDLGDLDVRIDEDGETIDRTRVELRTVDLDLRSKFDSLANHVNGLSEIDNKNIDTIQAWNSEMNLRLGRCEDTLIRTSLQSAEMIGGLESRVAAIEADTDWPDTVESRLCALESAQFEYCPNPQPRLAPENESPLSLRPDDQPRFDPQFQAVGSPSSLVLGQELYRGPDRP